MRLVDGRKAFCNPSSFGVPLIRSPDSSDETPHFPPLDFLSLKDEY